MSRLTKRNYDGSVISAIECTNGCEYLKCSMEEGYYCEHQCEADAMCKLADYEDAEEQGLLLRLPFEVGSEIYVLTKTFHISVNKTFYEIRPFKVDKFVYNSLKNFVIVGLEQCSNGFFERHFFLGEIGKSVFLTKEEAEQKLAEIRGDNNGKM
jgi:hypothetical protein